MKKDFLALTFPTVGTRCFAVFSVVFVCAIVPVTSTMDNCVIGICDDRIPVMAISTCRLPTSIEKLLSGCVLRLTLAPVKFNVPVKYGRIPCCNQC